MPVDEFGREIPGYSGSTHGHLNKSSGGTVRPPTGTGDGYSPPIHRKSYHHSHHHGSSQGGGGGAHSLYGGSTGSHPDQDPQALLGSGNTALVPSTSSITNNAGSSRRHGSSSSTRRPVLELMYVQEPMLCEYVWNDLHGKKHENGSTTLEGDHPDGMATKMEDDEDHNDNNPAASGFDSMVVATATPASTTPTTYQQYREKYCLNYMRMFFNSHLDDSWFRQAYSPAKKYEFLQQHIQRASREAQSILQTLTSQDERMAFMDQVRLGYGIKSSFQGHSSSHHHGTSMIHRKRKLSSSMDPYYHNTNTTDATQEQKLSVPKSHLFSFHDCLLHLLDIPPHVSDEHIQQAVLDLWKSHTNKMSTDSEQQNFHSKQDKEQIIIISSRVSTSIPSVSTSSTNGSSSGGGAAPISGMLHRHAYCIFPSPTVRQELLQAIIIASSDVGGTMTSSSGGAGSTTTTTSHVPRKEHNALLSSSSDTKLEWTIPCGDDAWDDGDVPRSGSGQQQRATILLSTAIPTPTIIPLSAAVSSKQRIARDKEMALKLIHALDTRYQVPHSLTSMSEMNDDLNSVLSELPDEDVLDIYICYLRRVHLFMFYNTTSMMQQQQQDRQHDYNIANLLLPTNNTIHVRLANADDFLQTTTTINNSSGGNAAGDGDVMTEADTTTTVTTTADVSNDLLVQRLENAHATTLSHLNTTKSSDDDDDGPFDALRRDAEQIQQAELRTRAQWLEEQCALEPDNNVNNPNDDDCRARCHFPSCRKLFKNVVFLEKHLLKKHAHVLEQELRKCHDDAMMVAWEDPKQTFRPVPPIWVDCGSNFGLQPSPLVMQPQQQRNSGDDDNGGSSFLSSTNIPLAEDPEPKLWEQEQERRRRRQEEYQQHNNNSNARDDYHSYQDRGSSSGGQPPPPRRATNFVDVDDMKEEKVELSFENVEVVPQPPKKKRKKKLL